MLSKEDSKAIILFSIAKRMLEAPKGNKSATAKKISEESFYDPVTNNYLSFSVRHIYRICKKYKLGGYEALKQKQNKKKGTHPKFDDKLINSILSLKKELPSRSADKIIVHLELAKQIEKGFITTRSVNRILNQYGYTREILSQASRVYIKHEKEHVNQLWLSDVMEGFYLDFDSDTTKKCYLICFEDDCSRMVTHAEFYFDQKLPKLLNTLKKAILKHGIPEKIYVDNGQIYRSDQFNLICAKLGIQQIFSTPYAPAGKGKCERLWLTVQKSFIPEIKLRKVKNITELNDLFYAWLHHEYDNKIHSSINMTPTERWDKSINDGQKLVFKSPIEIDEIFLYESKCKVNKYGVINFESNTYEAPGHLVNRWVIIKYDPFDLSQIKVFYDGKFFGIAKIIDLSKTKHKDVAKVVIEPKVDTQISKLYFDNLKINLQKHLQQQLASVDNASSIAKPGDKVKTSNDDVNIVVKKEKSIKTDDFILMVTSLLGSTELTYHEKCELHQLFYNISDFNLDIMKSILVEFKEKVSDFNSNFIFYIQQVKNIYLEKLSERRLKQ
jgi:putative transposase